MNILLVEDDNDSRTYLAVFLRELGHGVVECDNGYRALENLQKNNFNIVLSDIKMPRMSGLELLRHISMFKAGQAIDVVLFTGYGDMESAIGALRAGAYDYLLKPINIEELAATIERAAERQILRDENSNPFGTPPKTAERTATENRGEFDELTGNFAQVAGLDKVGIFCDSMRDIIEQSFMFHTHRSMPVLIQGETGTGKELIARYIHHGSFGVADPFVDVNCAAIMPSIFESELFGYEAGAFTGGHPKGQKGKLDIAKGGTLFLDEVTELSPELQAKLLRVIQEKEFYRVGGLRKIKTDVRIICATNVDIEEQVKKGRFRQDLYYRLNVGRIVLPPLRERREEIIHLANMFLQQFAKENGKRFTKISHAAAKMIHSYNWPGNIRELKNSLELLTFMYDDTELQASHLNNLPQFKRAVPDSDMKNTEKRNPLVNMLGFSLPEDGLDLENYVNNIVNQAYEINQKNKTKTAHYLGISRRSLDCRLKRLAK